MEKHCTKLLNNAVYGKTTKNVRNRLEIILVNTEKDDIKTKLQSQKISDNNLFAIQ